ncbi:hypothetical protein PAN31117_00164 [Pandoraea anapnoica]|uniref:Uncharacterized protein n=1 Tax=Pandoraea anapnoica TaxID=2508301 RepID=A0A5E4ZGT7_9BURK|nr:hypothetical protein [Pandoraea anapnoica]VVE60206.1 hypothetical protein PAN31117_00164 [Pandoraea anapnoica]
MPYASYRRATAVAPAYSLSHAVQHRKASTRADTRVHVQTEQPFSTAFALARLTTQSHTLRTSQTHSPLMQDRPRRKTAASSTPTVWPAAFALMLVANLIAPVASAGPVAAFVPKTVRRCHGNDNAEGDASGCAPPALLNQALPMPGDVDTAVRAEPINRPMTLKDQYSPHEVLRSIGTGSAPFRYFGDSVADLYTLLTGNTVSQPMREEIQQRAHLIDVGTGLIPEVALLRLPSEVANAVADGIDGNPITADRIISIVQSADPRALARPLGSALRPARLSTVGKKAAPATVEKSGGPSDAVHIESPEKSVKDAGKKVAATDLERMIAPADVDVPEPDVALGNVSDEMPELFIAGEQTYLQGYAQQIPAHRLPSDDATRLVIVDGQQYLRGANGFYLASQASNADHWLVDSPRRTKAQVPVTYDPHLDLWVAHEALRMCGGGCGNSRVTTPDSIALNRHEVDAVLSHLRDADAQNAILSAYNDVSRLKLLRSNRPDLQRFRDYSIIPNREAIRVALERIPPASPLYEQQRLAAIVTASHYRMNLGTEAFCQENAEILFHFLIENGVHGDCIRMITVHPKGRSPHALVLYTESESLIDALELATPVEYEGPGIDGISGNNFAELIMKAHDTTLLLDPWSQVKAVGFARSNDLQETQRVLDAAFADVGHRSGDAYRVSLTRPLGPRRTGTSRRGSLASQGSAGTVSGTSSSGGTSVARGSSSSLRSLDVPQSPLANDDDGADGV